MKKQYIRPWALFLIACLLCACLALPTMATSMEAPSDDTLENFEQAKPDISAFAASLFAIDSLEDANAFMDNYSIGILLITALISLTMAFCGYRALRIAILLGGFSAGWLLGAMLYGWLLGAGVFAALEPIPTFVPYLVYAVCGLVAAILAIRLIRVGIFLAAAAATFMFLNSMPVVNELIDKLITEEWDAKYLIIRLIVAVIVGAISLALTRPVLIVTTGAAGGMVAAISLTVAVGMTSNMNLEVVIGLILAAIGIFVQFSTGRRRRARR